VTAIQKQQKPQGADAMFSHIHLGAADFNRAYAFYSELMPTLDLEMKFCELDKPWAGWQHALHPSPLFIIGTPFNGQPASAGNGVMVAFLAETHEMVKQVYAKALEIGATCEGRPDFRPEYHPHYYGAYFRDLDGHKICVCCHSAQPTTDDE
jgi:catechol 2,3-dioxygenase-like lactoylglutathione lyase family enzyme